MEDLNEKLRDASPDFKVVVMPDFYLDYILSYPGKLEELTSTFVNVANRGGGNLVGWKHVTGRGGNATNIVAQLSALGCKPTPIIETDEFGKTILDHFLPEVDLSHVKTTGKMSRTVSFEAEHKGRRVNIMISDPGSHADFGPEKLTNEDREIIRHSDFVCLVNWSQNLKGTELAEAVFQLAKSESKAVTFFDPGDPTARAGEVEGLDQRVLTAGLVDVLSVNENELLQLTAHIVEDNPMDSVSDENSLFRAAGVFSMLAVRVDLHTPEFSATFVDGQRERVPCAKFDPVKVTGAGDVWNAADIFGHGIGLEHRERLLFANATAAAYLKKSGLAPVSMTEIISEIDSMTKQGHN
jgi:ribokinase